LIRPQAFITSVRLERSQGPHEYVSLWIRGQNVGTLCVGKGDGDLLRDALLCQCKARKIGPPHDVGCPALDPEGSALRDPLDEGTSVQRDEDPCAACALGAVPSGTVPS